MANTEVGYTLTLKDLLIGKLHEANSAAQQLESTMGMVEKAAGALGIVAGIYEVVSKIREWGTEYKNLQVANAQLKAGIESTNSAAGLSFEELNKEAEELRGHFNTSKVAITEMQSILLTFPDITSRVFGEASEAVADLSTRMKEDPKEAAVQIGKALQDPILGMTALHRVGVSFTEQQKQQAALFVATGHKYEAQMIVLKELNKEFGGSATAAFNADPMARFEAKMEGIGEKVGALIEKFEKAMGPAINWVADRLENLVDGVTTFVDWLDKGSTGAVIFKDTMEALAIVFIGYKVQLLLTAIQEKAVAVGMLVLEAYAKASAAATGELTFAMWGLDAVLDALGIGLITGGIALLASVFSDANDDVIDLDGSVQGLNNHLKDMPSVLDRINHSFAGMADGLGEMMTGLYTGSPELIQNGAAAFWEAAGEGKEDYGSGTTYPTAKGAGGAKGGKGGKGEDGIDASASKSAPNKAITINIAIGKLVETIKLSSTTISGGADQIQKHVSNALLQAVNDASLHAEI